MILVVKNPPFIAGDLRDVGSVASARDIPWRREWLPAPVFLSGESHGQKSLIACNAEDLGSILGSGRFPGEGNGYPPQYSCLENPMDREAWQATVHGVTKSRTQLSD